MPRPNGLVGVRTRGLCKASVGTNQYTTAHIERQPSDLQLLSNTVDLDANRCRPCSERRRRDCQHAHGYGIIKSINDLPYTFLLSIAIRSPTREHLRKAVKAEFTSYSNQNFPFRSHPLLRYAVSLDRLGQMGRANPRCLLSADSSAAADGCFYGSGRDQRSESLQTNPIDISSYDLIYPSNR